ncbi:MAG: hypothetical protein HQ472_07730 [Ignavibacteria bacterium]|nr:hypothetical protein [Ignavibacteria bacterium]
MLSQFRGALVALLFIGCGQLVYGQSQTTGTLNLRNSQPETVSLSIPNAGVTGYKLLLPPTIGANGQSMVVNNITGTTASLGWIDAAFWQLNGSAITTGGTAANQQYLGTSNAQDLVLASNGSEAFRIVGIAGPTQGYIGFGTTTPQAPIDFAKNVLLSNNGVPSELRFAEPSVAGTNYTAFRAKAQVADISYTLPDALPTSDDMALTATTGGVMSWQSKTQEIGRGVFIPIVGDHIHVINTGTFDLTATSVPIVSMMNPAGTTIGIGVTAIDAVGKTITVETSVNLGPADRICWLLINP